MVNATYVQTSFGGGLWGKFAQGRYHDPKYRTALNALLNSIPLETENVVRRPGFRLITPTISGKNGRLVRFDFEEQTAPYSMLFTDGVLGFISGTSQVATNDAAAVSSISNANPAVMTLGAAVTWNTGDHGIITGLSPNPLLENRTLRFTKVDSTHFSLTDDVTGADIDGSQLSPIGANAVAHRFLYFNTPYVGSTWQALRSVQTDADGTPVAVLLHADYQPNALAVTTEPTPSTSAVFGFGAVTFEDGPYLDPPTNGAQLTANQLTGIVELTISFPAYVSTTSYAAGDIVTSSSINYVSLVDQNIGNTPASSPTKWATTNGNSAINNGRGLLATDIGRLVRLFSEPALYNASSTYAAGAIVAYNPSGLPDEVTYWSSLVGGNTGNTPGTDTTHWQLLQQGGDNSPALWSWGVITSLINLIPNAPSGIAYVGNMTQGGGNSAAFNGETDQSAVSGAQITTTSSAASITLIGYVGQNYGGASPADYAVASATIFPSSDEGLVFWEANVSQPGNRGASWTVTAYLFGSNSAPTAWDSGTQLGSTIVAQGSGVLPGSTETNNIFGSSAVNIVSSNQSTTYRYLWVAVVANVQVVGTIGYGAGLLVNIAQVQFVAAAGSGTSANGFDLELLGAPLLYNTTIRTWRLGVYSGTTGWPQVGTWTDGRIWLSGTIPNRVDSCVSNGVTVDSNGTTINFAPTDQYGNVLDSSGISIVTNLPEANPILWMMPDQQGIICGTKSREFLIFPPTAGGFTPTNIDSRMTTQIGSANIEARRTEHTIVFSQTYERKIVEYFADVFSGKFSAPNLIDKAKQLTIGGIDDLAYQQELAPILWALVNGGALIGCTYKRNTLMTSADPNFNGWHLHRLGCGGAIQSICTGSSVNGNLDALNATVNVNSICYAMLLTDLLDEGSTQAQAAYLDMAVVPTSTSAVAEGAGFPNGGLQLNGLWQLNGFAVQAWLGGLRCGNYVVQNGSIQVPYGDGIGNGQGSFPTGSAWSAATTYGVNALVTFAGGKYIALTGSNTNNNPATSTANWAALNRGDQGLFTSDFVSSGVTANGVTMFSGAMPALVGFEYASEGQLLRPFQPADTGSRNGPGFAKLRRDHYLMAEVEGATAGVFFGTEFNNPAVPMEPAQFLQADQATPITVDQQFSGVFRDQFESEYTFDSRPCWQITGPYICNIQIFGAADASEDV